MSRIKSIGIIGLGSFGRFVGHKLPRDVELVGYDNQPITDLENIKQVSFETAATADVVILAIPLESYETVLPQLKKILRTDTLVVDICSVKTVPAQYFKKYLGKHPNILMTHPLFGPQSAMESTVGHQLIVTASTGSLAQSVLEFCNKELQLKISHYTAENHDKIMAQIHVLTFFMARGLGNMNLVDCPFITPSYSMITNLVEFDHSHSDELFKTIQLGNPYGAAIREQMIHSFNEINQSLANEKPLGPSQ